MFIYYRLPRWIVGLCVLKSCSPSIRRATVGLHTGVAAAILENIVTEHL